MKPTLYMYNLRNEKGRMIEMLCVGRGIACRHVDANDYGKRIGYIAEIDGYDNTEKNPNTGTFDDEMLIFKGFDQEMIGTFLAQYREAGIAVIPLKAGLTPTNVQWSSIELHAELQQEHQEFLKMKK